MTASMKKLKHWKRSASPVKKPRRLPTTCWRVWRNPWCRGSCRKATAKPWRTASHRFSAWIRIPLRNPAAVWRGLNSAKAAGLPNTAKRQPPFLPGRRTILIRLPFMRPMRRPHRTPQQMMRHSLPASRLTIPAAKLPQMTDRFLSAKRFRGQISKTSLTSPCASGHPKRILKSYATRIWQSSLSWTFQTP